MTRARWTVLLLAAALAAGVALRGQLIAAKRTLNHDEAISYLCAAGKQGLYRELATNVAPPFGVWTRAGEFKRFLEPDQDLVPGRIGCDLADTDIHPPLYFWLLHFWQAAVGTHLWTGPALNAFIAALGMLLLYGLARRVLRDGVTAAAVAGLWFLSPAVIETCFEARHYDLLALWTIGYAWALLRFMESRGELRRGQGVALLLTTLGGLLTHYHFVLMLAAGGVLIAFARGIPPGRKLFGLTAMALGGALFVALHPGFADSLLRAREQAQTGGAEALVPRFEAIILCYSTFFASTAYNSWLVHKYILPLGIMLPLGLSAAGLLAYRRRRQPGGAPLAGGILYLLLTMAAANAALYLSGVSPGHAMGAMYLAMVWPLLAFLPIMLPCVLSRARAAPAVLLCCAMLVSGTVGVQRLVQRCEALPDPKRLLHEARAVVSDNLARGILPPIVWHLSDERLVLAAPAAFLLENQERWLADLEPGTVFISSAVYGNTTAEQERLVDLLASAHGLERFEGGVFGVGRAYRLTSSVSESPDDRGSREDQGFFTRRRNPCEPGAYEAQTVEPRDTPYP